MWLIRGNGWTQVEVRMSVTQVNPSVGICNSSLLWKVFLGRSPLPSGWPGGVLTKWKFVTKFFNFLRAKCACLEPPKRGWYMVSAGDGYDPYYFRFSQFLSWSWLRLRLGLDNIKTQEKAKLWFWSFWFYFLRDWDRSWNFVPRGGSNWAPPENQIRLNSGAKNKPKTQSEDAKIEGRRQPKPKCLQEF